MNNQLAPIVMFVYNRPEHTKMTVEGILSNPLAKDSTLYIFSDGPKKNAKPEDVEKIGKVREYIRSITGFKDVIIEESPENKGLATSTIYGVSKVLENSDRVIMLEDDDVPCSYFLSYENECLEKYKDDSKIWCVGGYVHYEHCIPSDDDPDAYLVTRPTSWGFGTWKRCWDKVIWDVDTLKGLFKYRALARDFAKWGGPDFNYIMHSLFADQGNSWSIRYNFAAFLNDSYTIRPKHSLIFSAGMDGTGTHQANFDIKQQLMNRDVVLPKELKLEVERNNDFVRFNNPKQWIIRYAWTNFYIDFLDKCLKFKSKLLK